MGMRVMPPTSRILSISLQFMRASCMTIFADGLGLLDEVRADFLEIVARQLDLDAFAVVRMHDGRARDG